MNGALAQDDRKMPLSRNAKTGLVLAAVALAFFAAIVAKYWLLR